MESLTEYKKVKAIMDADVVTEIPDGVREARKHLMQCANLMLLCMESARYVAKEWEKRHEHTQIPNEHFQGLCQTFFIDATRWRLHDKMPNRPIK